MHNVSHPEASRYEKAQPSAGVAANGFPNPRRNHVSCAATAASGSQPLPKNEAHHNDTSAIPDLGSDCERSCVLEILRAAYRGACGKRRRIQMRLDLLMGTARALEANIYEPTFALERAAEHGLVVWPTVEVVP